jgi:hypothetical protein
MTVPPDGRDGCYAEKFWDCLGLLKLPQRVSGAGAGAFALGHGAQQPHPMP